MLTEAFFDSLKAKGKSLHEIAWESGITPNQIYRITSGIDRPKRNDQRVIKLCAYLNLPIDDAFEPNEAD